MAQELVQGELGIADIQLRTWSHFLNRGRTPASTNGLDGVEPRTRLEMSHEAVRTTA